MKRSIVLLVLVGVLALMVGIASANGDAQISIQNGDMISVTASENPQIVVAFGSQSGLDNVFIRCGLNSDLADIAEPAYTHGSFDRFSVARNGDNIRFIADDHPASGTNFGPGQFRNVAFTVDIDASEAEPGDAFTVTCRLLHLTDDPDDGFAQSTLAMDSTTIAIR